MSESIETWLDWRVNEPVWTPILHGLRVDALDCLQTGFALLSDHTHGTGSHLALGARYTFRTRIDGPFREVESTPDGHAAEARALLGLRPATRWMVLDGPGARDLVEPGRPLYLYADAYDLPWCPYHGHEHIRHSFLVTRPAEGPGVYVIDAYHNDTAWGPARPGVWRVSATEFDVAVAGGAYALDVCAGPRPSFDVDAVLTDNAERARRARPEVHRYLAAVREQVLTAEGLRRLVLDIWLLGRRFRLHEAWLATVHPAAGAVLAGQEAGWQQLAAHSYLALRRAPAGRPVDPAVVDGLGALLNAQLTVLERLAALEPALRNGG